MTAPFLCVRLALFWGLALAAAGADDAGETPLPLPAKWADDGKWANSPAEISGSGAASEATIRFGGFAQVCRPLPALKAGKVYRVRFDGTTSGQVEKAVLMIRRAAKPYTVLASDDLDLDLAGGRLAADLQVRVADDAPAGACGLYLVLTGVGTVEIPAVRFAERAAFLTPAPDGPAAGELVPNPRFLLREGGWCLNGQARLDGGALQLVAGGRLVQESPVILRVGRRYRVEAEGDGAPDGLSLSLRGEGDDVVRRFAPRLREGRWSEAFDVAPPESGMLPRNRPVYLFLESGGPARLTRVSLAEVAASDDRAPVPAEPVAYVRFERAGARVSRIGEGAPVDAVVRVAGVPAGSALSLRILDVDKAAVFTAEGRAASLDDGTLGFAARGIALPPGWFDAEVAVSGAAPLPALPGEIAVLKNARPGDASPDWVLGAHLQTWTTVRGPDGAAVWKAAPDAGATLEAAKALGIESQRMHPPLGTKWWAVEPEKGKWIFPDDLVDADVAAGVSILGLLDGTPRYASTAPPAQLAAAEGWPRNWAVFPSRDEADWRNYVRVMARRYQDRVRTWEIWNEPDNRGFLGLNPESGATREEAYVALVKAAADEVRKVDPRITVVAGAVTAVGRDFLLKAIDLGLLDACDAISFHGYDQVKSANRGTLAFAGMVGPLRDAMRRHGKTVPIWDTESSLGAMPEGRAGVYAAETELKGILARRASGISRLYLYNGFRKGGPLHQDFRMLWGYNDRPLPLQALLAADRSALGGAAFAANWGNEERGEHVFLFSGGGSQVVAAWTSAEPGSFAAPAGFSDGTIVDEWGVERGRFHGARLPLVSAVRYFVRSP